MKQKSKIILISLGHFIHDTYTSFLSPILPILIEKLGLTYTHAGALTVFLRLPAVLNPIIGIISDRIKMKYFVIVAPFITSVAMGLIGRAESYYMLAVLLLTAGFSASLYHVPAPVLIKRLSGERSGLGMSIFMIGGEGARTLGPILLMSIISVWGLRDIYKLIPVGFFTSILLFYYLRNVDEPIKFKNEKNSEVKLLKELYEMRYVLTGMFGSIICKAFTASIIAAFLPVYLKGKGYSLFISGSSLSIVAGASVVGVCVSGPLADIFGKKNVLVAMGILAPIAMLIFLFSKTWFIIPSLILLGVCAFSTTPVVMALIQDVGEKIPAFANSIYMIFNFLITSLIVLIVSKFFDVFGITRTLYLCVICALSGLPFVFFIPKEIKVKAEN